MSERELISRLEHLMERFDMRQEGKLSRVERELDVVRWLLRQVLRYFQPTAGILTATFSGDPMQAALIATLPTTRKDGSTLAALAIASITFQKTSLGADGVTAGPEVVLVTNSAADPTVGLTPDQIAFTDSTTLAGDSYTFFVTDTNGNVGDLSNAQVAPAATPPVLAAPSAGSLAATFS